MEKNAVATGALASFYFLGSDNMKSLASDGWCVLRNVLSPEQCASMKAGFNGELDEHGYSGRFETTTSPLAKELPFQFWSIDTCLLPLGPTATTIRTIVREAVACELKVAPDTLLSSFDGVMVGHAKCTGVGKTAVPQRIDANDPKLPTCDDGGGGAHIDQSRLRVDTAESHQIYLALTEASYADLSTAFLAPKNGWTLQGVAQALRTAFPSFYAASGNKRKRDGDIHAEGYRFPREQQQWLLERGMCKVIKPFLRAGDALIWSSALPHCGATGVAPKGTVRRARLGVIVAFAPATLVPDSVKALRREIVGAGYATGQQVIHASKHGADFPSSLRRFSKPEDWPTAYKSLLRRREEYKRVPLYVAREEDDDRMRVWRTQIRSLLG